MCHPSPCADARCYWQPSFTGLFASAGWPGWAGASVCHLKLFMGGRTSKRLLLHIIQLLHPCQNCSGPSEPQGAGNRLLQVRKSML